MGSNNAKCDFVHVLLDLEGDPGFVIVFASPDEVHQVLGLPTVARIDIRQYPLPPLQRGILKL